MSLKKKIVAPPNMFALPGTKGISTKSSVEEKQEVKSEKSLENDKEDGKQSKGRTSDEVKYSEVDKTIVNGTSNMQDEEKTIEKKQRVSNNDKRESNEKVDVTSVLSLGNSAVIVEEIEISKLVESPDEWNFYSLLPDEKMDELCNSIIESGLLSPIIVWERENDKYMILSGHNRVRAYKKLYNTSRDQKYLTIAAIVKGKEQITEDEARAIIIDTNFVQRQLTTMEKTKSIVYKYKQFGRKKNKSKEKRPVDVIAEEYGMSSRQVYKYYKLQNLIEEFAKRVDQGILSINAALKLASLNEKFQRHLYEKYNGILTNNKIINLDVYQSEDEIIKSILGKKVVASVNAEIQNEYIEELKDVITKWANQKNIEVKLK